MSAFMQSISQCQQRLQQPRVQQLQQVPLQQRFKAVLAFVLQGRLVALNALSWLYAQVHVCLLLVVA